MFRGKEASFVDPKHFGVGSIVNGGSMMRLMVVAVDGSHVRLLDLSNFGLLYPVVKVEDVNFMSEDEVRQLISGTNWAFTDFVYDPKGVKELDFESQ